METITEATIRQRLGQRVRLDIEAPLVHKLRVWDEPKNSRGGVSYVGRLVDGLVVVDSEVLSRSMQEYYNAYRPGLLLAIEGRLVDSRDRVSPYSSLVVAYDAQQRHLASLRRHYVLKGAETLYLPLETEVYGSSFGKSRDSLREAKFSETGLTIGEIAIQPMDEENQQILESIRENRRLRAAWESRSDAGRF